MIIQITSAQAMKSFAGAALLGLGLDLADAASCHLTHLFWLVLQKAASVVFWGILAGGPSSQVQILGQPVYFLSCPLQILASLQSLLHTIGSIV